MLPDTDVRVERNTAEEINARLDRELECSVHHHARQEEQIDRRLAELDQEWDMERTLEFNASVVMLTSVVMGTLFSRRWYLLSGIVAGFLCQHAVQGWCPPLPLFRRLGVRTTHEINRERYALKALRGDFDPVVEHRDADPEERGRAALSAADYPRPQSRE